MSAIGDFMAVVHSRWPPFSARRVVVLMTKFPGERYPHRGHRLIRFAKQGQSCVQSPGNGRTSAAYAHSVRQNNAVATCGFLSLALSAPCR